MYGLESKHVIQKRQYATNAWYFATKITFPNIAHSHIFVHKYDVGSQALPKATNQKPKICFKREISGKDNT